MCNTKIALSLFLCFVISSHFFSETQALPPNDDFSIAVGAYGVAQVPLGSYAKFARAVAGGGIVGEFASPSIPNLGFSARIQAASVIPEADVIDSYWVLAAFGGAFWRFSLSGNFTLHSEFAAGMWLHNIEASGKDNSSLPSSTFTDPAIQASVALRWKKGRIDAELAPVYTILLEKSTVLNLLGVRVGILYSIK